jgi:uncharacterized protein YkwD
MVRRKFAALMMVTVMAASMAACGDKTESSVDVDTVATVASSEATTAAATTAATKSAEEKASEEAASLRAEEIKASMAVEREAAAQAADTLAASQAASQAAAAQAEQESLQAAMEAAQEEVAGKTAGATDEVVTVVDTYGVESARKQYAANYDVYVELVRLTNELRASLGVAPVTLDESISIASSKKAVDYYLANYYDGEGHTMIDGRAWTTLFDDFGISWMSAGENIARGPAYKTAQQMFEGWKNSTIHYNNMINPKYTRIGVGSCGYVWIMDLVD